MVDEARLEAGTEPVVDVDNRNARSARVEHREKRSDAAERRTVTDARWHSDDRA